MEHLNARLLLTNVAKNSLWMVYTFLQKLLFFLSFSILEENCGANIKDGTFKCKFLLINVAKNCLWVGYCFLQTPLSQFESFNILEEHCDADIKNGTFKC